MSNALDILQILRAMRQSTTAMRVCISAHSNSQSLNWRIGELEFARQELDDAINHIERCVDEQCRLNPS